MQDDFVLKLAVGIKDLFNEKVEEISDNAKKLKITSEQLQQSIGDIKAFKTAEDAADKLHQQHVALTEQHEKQKSSLKTLRQEKTKLQKKQKTSKGLTNEEAMALKKLDREIEQAENQQRQLQTQLKQTNREIREQEQITKRLSTSLDKAKVDTKDLTGSMDKLEKELKGVNKQLKQTESISNSLDLKDKLSVGAVAAVGTAGTVAGVTMAENDEQRVRQAAAQTNLSLADLKEVRYKRQLQKLEAETGMDPNLINETMVRITQETGTTPNQAINSLFATIKNLKINNSLDSNQLVNAQGQMYRLFNMSFEQSADFISHLIKNNANRGDDLLETLNEYPALIKELGLNMEQGGSAILAAIKHGAKDSDLPADVLKGIREKFTDADVQKQLFGEGDNIGEIDAKLGANSNESQLLKTYYAQFQHGFKTRDKQLQSQAVGEVLKLLGNTAKTEPLKARNVLELFTGSKGTDDTSFEAIAAMGVAIQQPTVTPEVYSGLVTQQIQTMRTASDELTEVSVNFQNTLGNAFDGVLDSFKGVIADVADTAGDLSEQTDESKLLSGTIVAGTGAATLATTVAGSWASYSMLKTGVTEGVGAMARQIPGLSKGMSLIRSLSMGSARYVMQLVTKIPLITTAVSAGIAAMGGAAGIAAVALSPVVLTIAGIAAGAAALYYFWDDLMDMFKAVGQWWDNADFSIDGWFGDDDTDSAEQSLAGKAKKTIAAGATAVTTIATPAMAQLEQDYQLSLNNQGVTIDQPVIEQPGAIGFPSSDKIAPPASLIKAQEQENIKFEQEVQHKLNQAKEKELAQSQVNQSREVKVKVDNHNTFHIDATEGAEQLQQKLVAIFRNQSTELLHVLEDALKEVMSSHEYRN